MHKILAVIANLFMPERCCFCRQLLPPERIVAICDECYKGLRYNFGRKCQRCSTPIDNEYGADICQNCLKNPPCYKFVYAPLFYEKDVRDSILRFKFGDKPYYSKPLGWLIKQSVDRDIEIYHAEYVPTAVTFVPLHKSRQRERSYNQSELLAKCLAKLMKLPCVNTLEKIKNNTPQSRLKQTQRMDNVKGAYQIRKEVAVDGQCFLLVDDILTTGSTVNECAKVLIKSGAKDVRVAVAARNVPKKEK